MFDYEGAQQIERAWHEGLTPDPLVSVSTWADQHRMLSSKASAEPGRWRTARTPYLREIMDCLSPASPVERVIFMKGAQIGGNYVGHPDDPTGYSRWLGKCISGGSAPNSCYTNVGGYPIWTDANRGGTLFPTSMVRSRFVPQSG